MASPTLEELRETMRLSFSRGDTSVDAVARRLHCSPSTVHRRLRAGGTTFTRELNTLRAARAFELLDRGWQVAATARYVGLSPDHLRVVVVDHYQLTPRKIRYAVDLRNRLASDPCSPAELIAAKRDDEKVQELLAEIAPDHPLAGWAKSLVLVGHRPELHTPASLACLRAREQDRVDAVSVDQIPAASLRDLPDAGELLDSKEHELRSAFGNGHRRRSGLTWRERRAAASARPQGK